MRGVRKEKRRGRVERCIVVVFFFGGEWVCNDSKDDAMEVGTDTASRAVASRVVSPKRDSNLTKVYPVSRRKEQIQTACVPTSSFLPDLLPIQSPARAPT